MADLLRDRAVQDALGAKGLDPATRRVLEKLIMAIQANFDHISGEDKQNVRVFNRFVDHVNAQFNSFLGRLPIDDA